MAIVTFFFVICSIRTNVILWLVFVFIDLAFIMLMAVYWTLAEGMTEVSNHLQIVSQDLSLSIIIIVEMGNSTHVLLLGCWCFYLCLLCSGLVPFLPLDSSRGGLANSAGVGSEHKDNWTVREKEES